MATKCVFMQWLRTSLHVTLQGKDLISYPKPVFCLNKVLPKNSINSFTPLQLLLRISNCVYKTKLRNRFFKILQSLYISNTCMMQIFPQRATIPRCQTNYKLGKMYRQLLYQQTQQMINTN